GTAAGGSEMTLRRPHRWYRRDRGLTARMAVAIALVVVSDAAALLFVSLFPVPLWIVVCSGVAFLAAQLLLAPYLALACVRGPRAPDGLLGREGGRNGPARDPQFRDDRRPARAGGADGRRGRDLRGHLAGGGRALAPPRARRRPRSGAPDRRPLVARGRAPPA